MSLLLGPVFLCGILIGWVWKPKWTHIPDSRAPPPLLTDEDLEDLVKLVDVKDGGPAWEDMMNRFTPTTHYQAWRREPQIGPPQYRSRIVFENATPEIVRDFFWDDEFRPRWDDMLVRATTLQECHATGTMVVNWIRKFPFFLSDREYIIGRRIWESERSYYCVTKGVPYPTTTHNELRRVHLYYSSWWIRAVESRAGNGEQTACEVLLFHHEDMGIPREIAKLWIRHKMWGAVNKLESGLRAYQEATPSGAALSASPPDCLRSLHGNDEMATCEKSVSNNVPKMLVFGGAAILACSVNEGFLANAAVLTLAKGYITLLLKLCGDECAGFSLLNYLVNSC